MKLIHLISLTAAAMTLAVAPVASADSLVVAAPGAKNLTSGGGYMAWAAPTGDGGWRLAVRAPDGTVTTPGEIGRFRVAPDPSIGSDRFGADGRRLLVLYSRDGDVFAYDLRNGGEKRVSGASSRTYEEYGPSMEFGRMTFVRRGGRNNGVFYRSGGTSRRVSRATPRETSMNGSRVGYPSGRNVVIRRVSGRGHRSTVPTPSPGFGLVLTRYSLTWLTRDGRVFQTPRFGGSSDVDRVSTANEASRRLPATTNSIANHGSFVRFYLDGEGIKRVHPELFHR